ncbi:MAG: hypothetical protein HC883_04640 [Bdellovibrionaceae bacterium]|nr:hypothetical protein [Pseudobdellovibrionaceae bacterium]
MDKKLKTNCAEVKNFINGRGQQSQQTGADRVEAVIGDDDESTTPRPAGGGAATPDPDLTRPTGGSR